MRKVICALICFILMVFTFGLTVDAQLINYDRLKKQAARRGENIVTGEPLWLQGEVPVKNRYEKRYDINRDGKLQKAEVKVFLREVVKSVETRGRFFVNSDILKDYDRDNSKNIERNEIEKIKRDISK